MFCGNRALAEQWTYRYLTAAYVWAEAESTAITRIAAPSTVGAPAAESGSVAGEVAPPAPSTAEVRAWARTQGLPVPDRGRLRPDIWQAWNSAHPG